MTTWDWSSNWPAPAKLNLFLHVTGRRADGYHLLQTVFRFIDRCDWLRFAPRSDGQIVLTTPIPGIAPESNLTVRAARLLQDASGCRQGVDISLDKQLPMGGGLGGGSSDAATVLLALNHLWGTGLPRSKLEQLGLQLGADVPVFIHGRNVFAEGVGEQFTPVTLPPAHYLVLEPPVQVPTPLIFGAPELRRDTPRIAPGEWCPGMGHNDLETVALTRFPVLRTQLDWLGQFGPARMTGSGACLFAEFPDREPAEHALAQRPDDVHGWIVNGLEKHPLAEL